jgi:CubicO group peptidase (beta-lactamase class C family)
MISVSGLQQHLDEWRSGVGSPFVAAAVRADGRLLWNSGAGMLASRDAAASLSPRSRFPIYSITKTFTATCILGLEAAGLLRLDTPITEWIAEYSLPKTVTLAHLLRRVTGGCAQTLTGTDEAASKTKNSLTIGLIAVSYLLSSVSPAVSVLGRTSYTT